MEECQDACTEDEACVGFGFNMNPADGKYSQLSKIKTLNVWFMLTEC